MRASEDPALVRDLVARGITLNICPGSNTSLRLYPSRREHPLDALRRAGVRVTINTDDPAFQATDVSAEYLAAQQTYDWPASVLIEIARTSVEASFCPPALRQTLLAELDAVSLPA